MCADACCIAVSCELIGRLVTQSCGSYHISDGIKVCFFQLKHHFAFEIAFKHQNVFKF